MILTSRVQIQPLCIYNTLCYQLSSLKGILPVSFWSFSHLFFSPVQLVAGTTARVHRSQSCGPGRRQRRYRAFLSALLIPPLLTINSSHCKKTTTNKQQVPLFGLSILSFCRGRATWPTSWERTCSCCRYKLLILKWWKHHCFYFQVNLN